MDTIKDLINQQYNPSHLVGYPSKPLSDVEWFEKMSSAITQVKLVKEPKYGWTWEEEVENGFYDLGLLAKAM